MKRMLLAGSLVALLVPTAALAAPREPGPASFTTKIDNPYMPLKPGSRWVYRETDTERDQAEGRGHRDRSDQADRQRGHRSRGPRHRDREGRAGRGHVRLVRPGPQGQRLVPGRGHQGLRERQGGLDRGLVRGRGGRRQAGDRHARKAAPGHAVPPGALQGPRGGQGARAQPRRPGRGARRPLPAHR